tara:strand:+ start:48732 stop:50915 length:2184 start_codon:yes stop_codon:yes gene_type:complete
MSKKVYIGLSYDDTQLRLARLQIVRKKLKLISVSTIPLSSPLQTDLPKGLDAFQSGDTDEIFDLDIPTSSDPLEELDEFDLLEDDSDLELVDSPADDFGLDQGENKDEKQKGKPDENEPKVFPNDVLLSNQLEYTDASKLIIGLHIPLGKTTFQLLKGIDPTTMKKKERREFFNDKLQPIHQSEVVEDHYNWKKLKNGDCLIAYSPDSNELINLVEIVQTNSRKKIAIHEKLPDESIWVGLARANYKLKEEDITGLIALGKKSSRVLFMKGDELVSILPIITEGEDSNNVLNTVFSKILFELDKGDLPKIDRLLLVQSSDLSEMAKVYFQRQFDNIEVDYLVPDPDVLSYSDKTFKSPKDLQPYLSAIGAAWAATKTDQKSFSSLSLLPQYLIDKQQLYKIEWHGLIFLILIGLSPLFLNYLYTLKSDELTDLQNEIELKELQIESLRPTADSTEAFISRTNLLQNESNNILNLAEYSTEWSEVMNIVNSGLSDIPGLWITSVRNNGQNLAITGFSLSRNSIPQLAQLFTDVNILSVVETDLREETAYNFGITVNNFRQDVERYSPEMPVPVRMTETPEETVFSSEDNANSNSTPPAIVIQNRSTPSGVNNEDLTTSNEVEIIDVEIPTEGNFSEESTQNIPQQSDQLSGSFSVVLQSVSSSSVAAERISYLEEMGYTTALWYSQISAEESSWRISFGRFLSVDDAVLATTQLPNEFRSDLFIIRNL